METEIRKVLEDFTTKCIDRGLTFLWPDLDLAKKTFIDFYEGKEIQSKHRVWAQVSFYTWTKYDVWTLYSIEYFVKPMSAGRTGLYFSKTIYKYSWDVQIVSEKDDLL